MAPIVSAVKDQAPPARGDEVSPILQFVIREMVFNAGSHFAERIREYNVMARQDCHAEYKKLSIWARVVGGVDFLESCQDSRNSARFLAEGEWSLLVREDGLWDHRKRIRELFRQARPEAREQRAHHYRGFLYPHELWFHIHYGYVGKACGFSNTELLDGSPPMPGRAPRAAPNTGGLRRFEDPSDRESVAIGMRLYPFVPTMSGILEAIQYTPGLARTPLEG